MTTERKISASLNAMHETDRYILEHLPDKNVSETIKLALVLWFEIQDNGRIVIDRGEYDQLRQGNATAAPAGLVIDMPSIAKAITDGIVKGIAQAGLQGVASVATNGNGNHAAAPVDEDMENPDDPLVRAMLGLNFATAFGED